MLTVRQKQILDFIVGFSKKKKISPTIDEIRRHFRLNSPSTIHQHLEALRSKGYLDRMKYKTRSSDVIIRDAIVRVPLLGTIAAGQPIEAITTRESIAVPKRKILSYSDVYALRVVGNSMIEENINDGDVILVKSQSTADNGQTVVALIDNSEATLKKFYREHGHVRLQPANQQLKPIIIRRNKDISIQGIVLDVISELSPKSDKDEYRITKKKKRPYFAFENISIFHDDILSIQSIPNESIDLIITSPPYNVDIHYNSHDDNISYDQYLEFTRKWMSQCYKFAKSEGRFLLNIPLDKNKGGQKPVGADFTQIAKDTGWKYHSTIIWNEGNISRRTAWGSFMSASAPYVIAPVELILVLYKNSWKKTGGTRQNDITKKEFMDWTNGVWTFNGQNKKGAGGHPAPFPVELPRRCIKLFSYIGDTILDPFLGSGSTLIAATQLQRNGIGVDVDKNYCDIAVDRIKREANLQQGRLIE